MAQQPSSAALKKKREKMEKELRTLEALVKDSREFKEQSLNELRLLNKQILIREDYMKSMSLEIKVLEAEIEKAERVTDALEKDIIRIKAEFARLISAAYRAIYRNQNGLRVYGASNISESYRNSRYLKELKAVQIRQMQLIEQTMKYLADKRRKIELDRAERIKLIAQEREQQKVLLAQKEDQRVLYQKFRAQEEEHLASMRRLKKQIGELTAAINAAIEREIAEARRKTEDADKGDKEARAELDRLLPLTNSFIANKGRLPWPVPSNTGYITRGFGKQKLDDSAIDIMSRGIDISTRRGQAVRSVFNGKVTQIVDVPIYGKMILVNHGSFYTVYTHVEDPLVKVGEEVKTLQDIATAKTNSETGETKVHFQLFKNREVQNPEEWLVRK